MKVNFELTCPHCGKVLTDEKIVEEKQTGHHTTLFSTESDHQLVYIGVNLAKVYCLDVID